MGGGAAIPQSFCRGKSTIVNNFLVVAFNDNVVQLVVFDFFSIDFLPGVFPLTEGADVEVIVDDTLDGHDGPGGLDGPAVFLPSGFFPVPLRHAGVGMPSSVSWLAIFL